MGDSVVVRTTITDTGIGIKDEEIKELFSLYQQANVHNIHGGTGLGLSISKQLVNLMDGDIGIESSSSEGTSFWFTITLEAASEKFSYPDVPESGNLKILLIDGPEGSSSILKDYIESWGLQSHTATNWEEASKKLAQDRYDFVFIDNNIDDAFDKTRLDSINTREMSLVLVTACNDTDIGSQAIRVGYSACLIKPIRQSHLFDCIANLKGLNHLSSRTSDIESTLERPLAREITESSLILVVEDNPVNQKVALLQLRDLGFAAHAVGNGEEALSAAATTSYTMILMDCQMPILDGYEATKELRKREAITGKRTPIIAMTAHAMKGDRERCLAAGMDDYISKPVNQDKLKKITDKWLGITSGDSEESTFAVPIEYEILEKTFGKEARQEILDTFIESMEVRLVKIDAAIEDKERDAVAALLHDIKGMASSVFATELSRLAYITERRIQDKSDNWQYISKNFSEMKTLFKKIKQEINQLHSSKNGL